MNHQLKTLKEQKLKVYKLLNLAQKNYSFDHFSKSDYQANKEDEWTVEELLQRWEINWRDYTEEFKTFDEELTYQWRKYFFKNEAEMWLLVGLSQDDSIFAHYLFAYKEITPWEYWIKDEQECKELRNEYLKDLEEEVCRKKEEDREKKSEIGGSFKFLNYASKDKKELMENRGWKKQSDYLLWKDWLIRNLGEKLEKLEAEIKEAKVEINDKQICVIS
ncbi:MAG: hypothetical protein LBR43_00405 [Spiroplasmataceae bacterium]|nr:hypothetical protein [Spiroplasmataceae bacterium]